MQAGPGQKQRAGGPWNQKDKWKACHKPTTRGPVLSARGSQARGITKQHTRAKGADDRQVGQLSPSLAQGARQPVCQCLVLLLPSHSPQAAPLEAAPRKGRPRPLRVPAQLEAARARPAGSRNFLWPGATGGDDKALRTGTRGARRSKTSNTLLREGRPAAAPSALDSKDESLARGSVALR